MAELVARTTRRSAIGPSRNGRGRELTVLLSAQAMAAMADALVTVSVPAIRGGLHLSGAQLELTASGFVLAYAAMLLTGARMGDYGHRAMFLVGMSVFTAGAAVSGTAPDGWVLIAGQVVQGLGAALMVPQVLSLIQLRFHGLARARALALYSMVLAVGVAAGQLLGGLLVTTNAFGLAWRLMFLIQIPAGAMILVAGRVSLPTARMSARRHTTMARRIVVMQMLTESAGVPLPSSAILRYDHAAQEPVPIAWPCSRGQPKPGFRRS